MHATIVSLKQPAQYALKELPPHGILPNPKPSTEEKRAHQRLPLEHASTRFMQNATASADATNQPATRVGATTRIHSRPTNDTVKDQPRFNKA